MNDFVISVIVPSLNQGRYIDRCLSSIVSQTDSRYELIVIDGGSTDETLDVIKKFQDRIDFFCSEADDGQSSAIARGFQLATGNIICWLNSDDFFEPNTLSFVQSYFEAHPDVTMLIGESVMVNIDKTEYRVTLPECDLQENFLCGQACPQPSTFMRRSAYHDVGTINVNLHFTMDWDLFARLSLLGSFSFVNKVLSKQSLHDQGKMVKDQHEFVPEGTFVFLQLLSLVNGGGHYIQILGNYLGLTESNIAPLANAPKYLLPKQTLKRSVLMFLSKRSHYLYSINRISELRDHLNLLSRLDPVFYVRHNLFLLYVKSLIPIWGINKLRAVKPYFLSLFI